MNFEDIKIIDFDEKKSTKRDDQHRDLFHMYLILSASPPTEWAAIFDDEWKGHLYSKKQRAMVSGKNLVMLSTVEDLEKEHIPELKAVITAVNAQYRRLHNIQDQAKQKQKGAEEKDRNDIRDLKNRLTFD